MKELMQQILLCLCLLLAACGPAGEAEDPTDADVADAQDDTSSGEDANANNDNDAEQADANEADVVEEVGEPVACEPFDGLIQENMTDCGLIIRSSFGLEECASTQTSCVLDALSLCTPFFVLVHKTNMIDIDDIYSLVYSIGRTRDDGQCEYSVISDGLTSEIEPAFNQVVRRNDCILEPREISRDMCFASFESNCASIEVLGTCADVYASCPLCTEGRP